MNALSRAYADDTVTDREQTAEEGDSVLQLVAVHIGDEIYAFGIGCINSIIMPQTITRVPRTPDYVVGVMNLRGHIVPIIDLRKRFGLPPITEETSRQQRVVIVEVDGLTAGLVVDSVSEVLHLPKERVEPPSLLVVTADAECITGIGRTSDDRLLILLDVYKTLTMKPGEDGILRSLSQGSQQPPDSPSQKANAGVTRRAA